MQDNFIPRSSRAGTFAYEAAKSKAKSNLYWMLFIILGFWVAIPLISIL